MSVAASGKNNSMYGVHLVGELNKCFGRPMPIEQRIKIALGNKGKKFTKEHKKKIGDANRGSKSYLWKGGITTLGMQLYSICEYKSWRKKVYERDHFTCQECGRVGGNLEAHHIKEFRYLLKEFLNIYNQFSPIDDKETLIRLAVSYAPFWDISNGKTLCIECHNLTKKGQNAIR